jgi:hypothetical protein
MNQKTVRRIRGMEVHGVEKRHGEAWSDVERAAVVERVLQAHPEAATTIDASANGRANTVCEKRTNSKYFRIASICFF